MGIPRSCSLGERIVAQRRGVNCHPLLSAFLLSLMDTDWIFILSSCFTTELRLQNVFQCLRLLFPNYWVALGGWKKQAAVLGTNSLCQDNPLTVLLLFVVWEKRGEVSSLVSVRYFFAKCFSWLETWQWLTAWNMWPPELNLVMQSVVKNWIVRFSLGPR